MPTPLSEDEIQAIEERYQTDEVRIYEDNWAPEKVIRDLVHAVRYYKQEAEAGNDLIISMSQRMRELVQSIGKVS